MKVVLGSLLAIVGMFCVWVCGVGVLVSTVAWVCSLVGLPLITGAGTLAFKFAAGWLVAFVVTLVGGIMVAPL
jgi:hypothetical protein